MQYGQGGILYIVCGAGCLLNKWTMLLKLNELIQMNSMRFILTAVLAVFEY